MTTQNLADVRARLLVEGMEPAAIHFWAQDALEEGADTPALRQTAEADVREPDQLRRYFDLALDELGAPTLSEIQARWRYVLYMAQAAVDNEIDATNAVRRIVWGAAEPLGRPSTLQSFVDAISEADQPGARQQTTEATCLRRVIEYLSARPVEGS